MSRKSKRQWDNDFLYNNLHAHYENIGTSMWKWEGLPDYVNPKYPEQTLYENGMCVAMKPDNQDNIYLLPGGKHTRSRVPVLQRQSTERN